MDHVKFKKAIVTNAVRKGIRDIKNDSDRGIRYLVDLGAHFSKSLIQKEFFHTVQTLLRNPKSAYYNLVTRIVKNIDSKTLETVGINIGYMSWTYGANIIRKHEAEHGYNVPWTIFLDFDYKCSQSVDIAKIIEQGQTMGIYTYMVFVGDVTVNIAGLLKVFEKFSECAFVLFSNSDSSGSLLAQNNGPLKNIIISIGQNQFSSLKNMKLLADARRFTGIHYIYDDNNAGEILSGGLLRQFCELGYNIAFFIAGPGCNKNMMRQVAAYVNECRIQQQYPIFICNLFSDVNYIDSVISVEPCMAQIRCDGTVTVENGTVEGISALNSSLEQILKVTMPKASYINT